MVLYGPYLLWKRTSSAVLNSTLDLEILKYPFKIYQNLLFPVGILFLVSPAADTLDLLSLFHPGIAASVQERGTCQVRVFLQQSVLSHQQYTNEALS